MVELPDFRSHSKSRPFGTQPLFDHSKSRLVWISDPHCIVPIKLHPKYKSFNFTRHQSAWSLSYSFKSFNRRTLRNSCYRRCPSPRRCRFCPPASLSRRRSSQTQFDICSRSLTTCSSRWLTGQFGFSVALVL